MCCCARAVLHVVVLETFPVPVPPCFVDTKITSSTWSKWQILQLVTFSITADSELLLVPCHSALWTLRWQKSQNSSMTRRFADKITRSHCNSVDKCFHLASLLSAYNDLIKMLHVHERHAKPR